MILSNNIVSIGDSTFEYCTNLENISMSNSITEIGKSVFKNCNRLKTI